MSLPIILRLSLLLPVILILSSCGGAGDNGSLKPNSFPPTSSSSNSSGFNSGSTSSGTTSSGLTSYQIRVTVQLPKAIVPNGTATHRNLNVVQPSNLRVEQVSQELNVIKSYPFTQTTDTDGSTVLTFEQGEFPNGTPLRPDIIVQADVDTSIGTVTVSAPAANETRDILINPFSEYLVKNVFSTGFSSTQLNNILNCIDTQSLCVSEMLWPALSDQVQSFEIDIPDTLNEDQAVSFLGTRVDFTNFTNGIEATMVDNASTVSEQIAASSVDFNALVFGAELDQAYPTATTLAGQWGVRSSVRVLSTDANGSSYTYPGSTLASFSLFGFAINSIGTDVPYARGTLQQQTDGTPTTKFDWQTNTHAASPGAAAIVNNQAGSDSFLLTSRAQLQSVTTATNSTLIGWSPNPYFFDGFLYGGATSPSAVIGSYFHSGKAIQLIETSSTYQRQRTLEDMNTGELEFNIAKPSSSQTVKPTTLSGNYNAISFAVRLSETATPITVATTLHNWLISGQTITDAGAPSRTQISRNNSNIAAAPITTSLPTQTWTIGAGQEDPTGSSGRLTFVHTDSNNTAVTESGAASPDGNLAGFMIANTDDGQGMMLAMKQPSSTPVISGITYKLQGVSLAMNNSTNTLSQYNSSTLSLDSAYNATLNLSGVKAVHTLSSQEVSKPQAISPFTLTSSSPMTLSASGEAKVSFTDGTGTLTLDGYVSPDSKHSLLILSVRDTKNQEVGLLFGYRQ